MSELPNSSTIVGLAGRYIAETNAFLALHWDDAGFRWPLKLASNGLRVTCDETAADADEGTHPLEIQSAGTCAVKAPDLLAQIQQLGAVRDRPRADDEPQLVLVFLTAASSLWPPGGIDLLRNVRIVGVTPAGVDIASVTAPSTRRNGRSHTPRRAPLASQRQ